MLQLMRQFKTRYFSVRVEAHEEYDLDLSWDDDGSVRKGLDSGKFIAFGVVVKVFYKGNEVGRDSIWGNVYESIQDFMDHKECGKQNREYAAQGKEGRCGSYFTDLIHGAIAESRKTLKDRPYIRA